MRKTNWILDMEHSSLAFKVNHMAISTVTGQFKQMQIDILDDEQRVNSGSVHCRIDTDSVTTGDSYRDQHIKSDALLDVMHHPEIDFVASSFNRLHKDHFTVRGLLTIKESSREIDIPVKYLGWNEINGKERIGFESLFAVDRDSFNLTYHPLLERGGMVIGQHIHIEAYFTFLKDNDELPYGRF